MTGKTRHLTPIERETLCRLQEFVLRYMNRAGEPPHGLPVPQRGYSTVQEKSPHVKPTSG